MDLGTKLTYLPGIGPSLSKKLERLSLYTVEDLINHYPFRYEDFSKISPISGLRIGESVTVRGEVWAIKNTYTRFRKVLTKATLNDGSGSLELVWFNQPWLSKNLKTGDKIQASGKIDRFGYKTTLVSPEFEKAEENSSKTTLHTGRLVPVYPETFGLTSKWLRQKIASTLLSALPQITDPLPDLIQDSLLALPQAIKQVHFPQNWAEVKKAKERLSFDELFFIQLATQKSRLEWQQKQTTKPWTIDQKKLSLFVSNLPFPLTDAQKRVIQEVVIDLQKGYPMNRLIQGEVGSGKTVVAAAIIHLAHLNNLKSIIMAPTEILAFQHFSTLSKLLESYGIKIGIYTGSKKFTKTQDSGSINQEPGPQVIVGTHALLSKAIDLDNVGLVVVDEQQRFGVEQRTLLREKTASPHFLTMTATPIPRTVALTIYGDLDLSVIDQMPLGRKVVRTHFVPGQKRADSYKFIDTQIKQGHQAYIITPLIEESETQASAKAAKVEFERLKKEIFPHLKLGLLHGKLKSKEKEEVVNNFKNHQLDILVSTSVVEVGVDVPNATIMVIEGAERFGLAQLHQLRGRVGRGEEQSYTFLFAEDENPQVINRLKNLEKIHNGLELSELDLKIRGGGEVFGTAQSGRWNLKIASLSDLGLVEKTRLKATQILSQSPDLDKYPQLKAKLHSLGPKVSPD